MHRLKSSCFFSLLSLIFLFSCSAARRSEQNVSVSSPGNTIHVEFSLKDGIPYYSINRHNTPIVELSKMGFTLKHLPSLQSDFELRDSKKSTFDETWTQPWGEVKDIRNHYNSLTVELAEKSGDKRKMNIEFRVYDDGVGFRYIIPQQTALGDFVIMDELTEFNMAHDFKTWWIPAYGENMDYEALFKSDQLSTLKEKMHTPVTMESGDSLFVSIHEAALMDYAAMAIAPVEGKRLKCDLVPWSTGEKVKTASPLNTPWRTLQITGSAGDLVTSYLILNLNEPNKLGDVSWIQPGKYNGIWWGMHIKTQTWEGGPIHGATTANVKKLIDFASQNNLSAVLIEGWNEGWDGDWTVHGNFNFTKPYPDYDIAELSRYAKEKNIGLIAHHETGGNVANYEKQLEDAFKFMDKYDIRRVKTGYVNQLMDGKEKHQSQYMVRHYQKVLETAARYKVMVDMHEPIKDTGLRRTYPNMMTREGARGQEYEAWSEGNPPEHTTILPFTRGLSGPMDYTPGVFDIEIATLTDFRVHTTLAKQLALYVVIYSPMHMVPDLPENYKGNPAFKFIVDVPTDWSDTKVLNAKIGDYTTIVRKDRNSNDWYLGSVTDEAARTLTIILDFLDPGKQYEAEIYADGKGADMETNPLPVEITRVPVTSTSELKLVLAPGGGQAIRFHQVN